MASCLIQVRVHHLAQPSACSRNGKGCVCVSPRVGTLASKTSANRTNGQRIVKNDTISESGLKSLRNPFRRSGTVRALQTGRSAASIVVADANSVKEELRSAVAPIDRGIFGCQKAERAQIAELVQELEAFNPLPAPTESLEQVAGDWRLIYTTLQILGNKRTKLGLRTFVNLGDFVQRIDLESKQAVNNVAFNVVGLGSLEGMLSIKASFEVVSPTRVDIKYQESTLVPDKLQTLFNKNVDLLLAIFNPEGWLELTYVDEEMRIGHDDKGNVFVLEKM
mmetsp:Transcript_12583/g.21298  ORF Transcript_12583/g.21298 Transcript_12583/m.21298 type:complete len:279 (-) Transcript_12583:257-1093(-)|eukprot:CAMPEP_0198212904 /NCGR_PEP_ID=MMETSP1445-20131203/28207_1 /TAXON_ID=36898 /ORGANISM="Pyramimonas sp., Strain CCMP2087" /LENGTH=278 /DNA_ID=CAMNT_0043887467 /DNA_START=116 /DNA_END=952 /DNA_ORIENTATION=+